MLWLRGLLKLGLKIVGVFSLLSAIVFLFLGQDAPTAMIVMAAVFSFFAFLIGQLYDQILLKLNPTGNVLFLS